MQKRFLFLAIAAATLVVARAQDSIVYVSGPSFQIPGNDWARNLDVDSDGAPDFSFWETGVTCTADLPTSSCGWPFLVGAVDMNQMLMIGYDVQPQWFGEWIGDSAPAGAVWNAPSPSYFGAGLAYWWYSRQGRLIDGPLVQSGWAGPIGHVGVGYVGIRFHAADGLHYGWIRVRLPQQGFFSMDAAQTSSSVEYVPIEGVPIELVPMVVDWAYETRPNTPIRAGAISSNGDSIQLTADFGNAGGAGTFILTGDTLRGELTLAGRFTSAEIRGPANIRSKAKPVWSFGPPLVSREDYTAFFGEVTLTHGQIMQLLRGAFYVSVENGAVTGLIVPGDKTVKKSRH